ncbi:hypothetical protein GGR58DRAFT_451504 [Xylaria digitata]|nr:hypothetical protein GGR58DRAFT_451504 [Xylaria digitata]
MDHHLPDAPSDIDMAVDQIVDDERNSLVEEIKSLLEEGFSKMTTIMRSSFQEELERFASTYHIASNHQELIKDVRSSNPAIQDRTKTSSDSSHDHPLLPQLNDEIQLHLQKLFQNVLDSRLNQTTFNDRATSLRETELLYQLNAERAKNRKLTEINNSLRNALIRPAQHVLDDDVIRQFLQLRSSLLRMVKSTFEYDTLAAEKGKHDSNPLFQPFRAGKRPMKYLANRVHGAIFMLVYDHILSRPVYPSKWGSSLEDIETALLTNIPSGNLNFKDFVDWRSASMKCAQALRKDNASGQNDRLSATVDYIWQYLYPLKLKTSSSEAKGHELLEKLCSEAYSLAQLMRSGQDVFEIKVDLGLHDLESIAEVDATEDGYSRAEHQKIAFWTFGALTKRTEEDPKSLKVIEKGQVVMYR